VDHQLLAIMTSKATKRKHVTNEVLNEFVLPTPEQKIVKVVSSVGNNLHQVGDRSSEIFGEWGEPLKGAMSRPEVSSLVLIF